MTAGSSANGSADTVQ